MTIITERAAWTLPQTLGRAAERFADRTFVSFGIDGQTLTYAEVDARSAALAGGLRALGVGRGDRVLIMLRNRAEFVLSWFAINRLGAVQVPVNIEYAGEFLEHVANTAQAALMILEPDFAAVIEESRPRLTHLRRIVVLGDDFDRLLESAPAAAVDVTQGELAAIHFTSGTTGRSKGSMMSHAQQHLLSEQNGILVDLGPEDIYLTFLPLFHINAQATAVYAAMLVGAHVHLESRFSVSRWIDLVRDTGATVTTTLGVMMQFILSQPPRADDRDNRLRCVWAVPCPVEAAEEFGARFAVEHFAMPYGNTEVGTIIDPRERPPEGSCGRVDDRFFEARVVDPESDEPLAPGTAGELIVRGRVPWVVSQGYFGMPDRTVEAYRNLWFHTGDSLVQDEDGWLWFVDRIKERIRRRGENIASADIEHILGQHPAIAEVAVVALPSEIRGGEDELKACVVAGDGALDVDALFAWCDERLPRFAVPRYVEVLDALPKTPTAKVRKELLRAAGVSAATVERRVSGAGAQA
jgi:crotonobetaine/carnitine-CoA ligase